MRIAVGGIFHESNGFSPIATTLKTFEEGFTDRDQAIFTKFADAEWESAGCLEAAKGQADVELVGTLNAWAWPAGPLTNETFRSLLDELKERIVEAGPDGVVLLLHGAMLVDSHESADATIVGEVRDAIGPGIPLGVSMDFHANIDAALIEQCDVAVGYDTYPHVDLRNTGRECTEWVIRAVRGEVHPATAILKLPLMPHILKQQTAGPPMGDLMARTQRIEGRESILSASVFGGFFWADIPHAGMSVVVVADGDPAAAAREAANIAAIAWERRREFSVSLPSPAEAVRRAIAAEKGPLVLADLGDNVGGGSPGDATMLLAELVKQGADGVVLVMADPESVRACQAAGPGATLELRIGGKADNLHGEPVEMTVTVSSLHEGKFKNIGPMRDGIVDDMGPSAVVRSGGIAILLTSLKMPMWNLQQLRSCGIEPTEARIIVAKGAIAHRAAYLPIAAENIEVDTPGITCVNPRRFTFEKIRRPIYPLDEDLEWSPG